MTYHIVRNRSRNGGQEKVQYEVEDDSILGGRRLETEILGLCQSNSRLGQANDDEII